MLDRKLRFRKRAAARFAAPPWNHEHSRWRELDEQLPPDHVARAVVAATEHLDWSALYACYSGGGSPATHPLLMLRIVLIEMQRGRFRPQQWWHDTQENEALKWAGFGICPSRSAWYAFHDRVGPLLAACNAQLVERAIAVGVTDGVSVAVRGQVPPMQELFSGLELGLGVAIVAIFLLLAANFQSFRLSLASATSDCSR